MPILAHPENPWIICQSSHTLETHQHNSSSKSFKTHFQSLQMHPPLPTHSLTSSKTKLNASAPNFYHLILLIRFFFHLPRLRSWSILYSSRPLSLKFTNSLLLLKVNNVPLISSQFCFWNSASMTLVHPHKPCQSLSFWRNFSIVIQTSSCPASSQKTIFIHWSTDPSLSTDDLNNFRPITNLNFISRMLEKVVASHIQSHLSSNSLSFFNLLTGSFILLKLLFLKFTMTSSLRWIMVRSLAFFLTYLQPLILSIIPSFSLVFTIGSVLMVFHLIGPHLISHLILGQSQSMIPSLHSLLFPVVYPKVPFLTNAFYSWYYSSWFDDLNKFPNIHCIICTLMTPSCTSLSLQRILFYLLKDLPPLSMTFSPGWTWTNCSSIHQKLNFLLSAQYNNVSYLLILETNLSAMISSQSVFLCSQSWFHLWLWHVFLWLNQLCI